MLLKLVLLSGLPNVVSTKKSIKHFKSLTPECQILYKEYKKSQRQLSYAKRTKRAVSFTKQFETMTAKMNQYSKKILWMQLNLCTKKAKARRFSMDEKLIALTIQKQSPK